MQKVFEKSLKNNKVIEKNVHGKIYVYFDIPSNVIFLWSKELITRIEKSLTLHSPAMQHVSDKHLDTIATHSWSSSGLLFWRIYVSQSASV